MPISAHQTVYAGYAEVALPFVTSANRKPPVEALEPTLAGRFEHLSIFGRTTKSKASLLLTSAGEIGFAAGSSDIVTLTRGMGFDDTTDSAGEDSFAVEAWFKADSATGLRSIFSNTESYRGFALRINAGQLQGLVRFANGSSYVSVTLNPDAGTPALTTGRWYYAVLHCRKQASYYQLRLYLDGVKIGSLNTASLYNGIRQCTELPKTPWTISEYGARYYQKRTSPAPWDDLYPFLFGISP